MNLIVHVHALTVAVAASYLTLLIGNPDVAVGTILWVYAVLILVLAVACLVTERNHRGH